MSSTLIARTTDHGCHRRPAHIACCPAGAVLTAWLAAMPVARAAPAANRPTIVLEAHVGERSSDVAAVMEPIVDELEHRGFAARPTSIGKLLGGQAPRPGVLDGGKTAADIARAVDRGLEAFTTGRFKEAEAALTLAAQQIMRNPALMLEPVNAGVPFKALVGLALSQARLGDSAGSVATMTEVIRMSPARPVGRAEYGPQADQLYQAALRQARARGRGRLSITAGDERAQIYVDGNLQGTGKVSLGDVLPGTCRVFIQVPGGSGRQYEVEVAANRESTLDVNWKIDSRLTVSGSWVGFVFPSDTERAQESSYAADLARRSGSEATVVVGTVWADGKPAVIGTMYRATGDVVRSGLMIRDGDDDAKLRALARFVADGTPSHEIEIVTSAGGPRAFASSRTATGRSALTAKLLIVGGAAVLGVGMLLLAIDQDPGHVDRNGDQTPTYRNTAPIGVVSGVAGLASIGVGVWLLARRERGSPVPVLALVPSGALIGWAGEF